MNSKANTDKGRVAQPNQQKGTNNVNTAAKENIFAGAGDVLSGGIDSLFTEQGDLGEVMVKLDDIEIRKQVREKFEEEDDPQSLAELGRDLRKRQLQAILLTPNPPGSEKPYRLVAGERRVRGARIEGLLQLRAKVQDMTEEEIEDAQFAENIHRLNLTQIEEAKKIQRDLDQLGSIDAVLAKHNKSRAWLSKILSLLKLPEQAKRLVTEGISADLEVINAVKIVENADPAKAKDLVDDLKKTRGKASARDKVAAVKDEVKPAKGEKKVRDWKPGGKTPVSGAVATPKDRSAEAPGPVTVKKGATADVYHVLAKAYIAIFEQHKSPKSILDAMSAEETEAVEDWLQAFFAEGLKAKNVPRMVIEGFRGGLFSSDLAGAFALVAFLQGSDPGAKFNVLNILGSVKE